MNIRLNPNVAYREFDDIVYLENQTTHVHLWLGAIDASIVRNIKNGCILSQSRIYDDKYYESFTRKLHQMWFVDRLDLVDSVPHEFSYANKSIIEKVSSIPHNWQKTLYRSSMPWLNNLQIELTDQCNERCVHCYMPTALKDEGVEMTFDEVHDLLRQYRRMNGLKVVLSGGEIFLHKRLFDILELCRRMDMFVLLQTNMLILDQKRIDWLKHLRIFNIQVSLYSVENSVHDAITSVKGSCEITKKNIRRLVENDIPVMIACPVMYQNFDTVPQVAEFAKSLNIEVYYDYVMMARSDGDIDNLNNRLTLGKTHEMIDFLLDTRQEFINAISQSTSIEQLLSKKFARRRDVCDIMSSGLCIAPDGIVYPCPGWKNYEIGNIKSERLETIWNCSVKGNYLRSINMEHDFDQCINCELHNFCDMCAVYNYNENSDIFKISRRFCEVAAIFRQAVIDKYHKLNGNG